MFVIATAGHVDHGKSTLVRKLTGMEPDRWAQERRRGMTIDLGYAWTALAGGRTVAFVDVPGHERFIGNMLAGLGPVPAVMMVVAADDGWRQQSAEHLAAIDALGLRYGLLALTRCDRASPAAAEAAERSALAHIADSSLGTVEAFRVSGLTGAGLEELRGGLSRLFDRLPEPARQGRVRLWVDRSFTIRGSGTVVTGTLSAGTLHKGDPVQLRDKHLRIRGLHSLGEPADAVSAVARVAVNLRSVAPEDIPRGSALVTPDAWLPTSVIDVRTAVDSAALPAHLMLHLGTGAFPVRVRSLAPSIARLTLVDADSLPLEPGDGGILRDPGTGRLHGGIVVLDAQPPPLRRRGSAKARGAELAAIPAGALPGLTAQVRRRGFLRLDMLAPLGLSDDSAAELVRVGHWLIAPEQWEQWSTELAALLAEYVAGHPMQPGLSTAAAQRAVGVPDLTVLRALAERLGLVEDGGQLMRGGAQRRLGSAEAGIAILAARLAVEPFSAAEQPELDRLGLGPVQLAAAESAGRLIRLGGNVVLLPEAAATAVARLANLPQPFTTSQARQALATTRRVAVPLLEFLDRSGRTRQVEPGLRVLR